MSKFDLIFICRLELKHVETNIVEFPLFSFFRHYFSEFCSQKFQIKIFSHEISSFNIHSRFKPFVASLLTIALVEDLFTTGGPVAPPSKSNQRTLHPRLQKYQTLPQAKRHELSHQVTF